MNKPSKKRIAIAACVGGAILATAGVTWAAIPDSGTGLITGCYKTAAPNQGVLRVIDAQAGKTCAAGETKLTWNQRGVTFKGAWSRAAAYLKNDLVTVGGAVYIANSNNTAVTPPNPANWGVFATGGAQGPRGTQGPQGAQGPQGPVGVSGYERVVGDGVSVERGTQQHASVSCPVGKVPLGGGATNGGGYNTIVLTDSFPDAAGWTVFVNNYGITTYTVRPYVVCAYASS